MRLFLGLAVLTLAAACSSADRQFESSCKAMAKSAEDMSKDDQKAFCGCMTTQTADMDRRSRKEIAKLMRRTDKGDRFDQELEEAIKDGRISSTDGRTLFSAMKGCSVDLAM